MGQLISHQVASATESHIRGKYRPQRQHLKREPPSKQASVGDSLSAPKRAHRKEPKSSRTRSTNEEQGIRSNPPPSKAIQGNIGSPRRQEKYGRNKKQRRDSGTSDQNHLRTHQDEGASIAAPTNPNDRLAKPHSSNTGSKRSKARPTKECIICTDTRSLHHFPTQTPTEQCTHDIDVCRRCLRRWIESSFTTKMWNEMTCPVCAAQMQYDDVRAFASKEVFRR